MRISLAFFIALSLFSSRAEAQAKSSGPAPMTKSFRSTLPLVHVNTNGKAIGKEDDVEARVTLLEGDSNDSTALLRSEPTLFARIKVRGYSSSKFSKKQYDLELHDALDGKKDVKLPLLGLPTHHRWVLAAPYIDRALVRNALAFDLARSLPDVDGKEWYAPRTRPIELFLNGQYHGVYFLTEKIDISKGRLNIGKANFDVPEESPFLVKVENTNKPQLPNEHFRSVELSNVTYYEPKAKKIAELMKTDRARGLRFYKHVQGTINNFEKAVAATETGDFQSYRKMVEPVSFQNFILLQEVSKNLDGLRRSVYVHYHDGLLRMGPAWDFDLAFANIKIFGQMKPEGFQVGHDKYIDGNPELFWFRYMLKDPKFQRDLVRRYKELRQPGQPLSDAVVLGHVERLNADLQGAHYRNFSVWKINPGLSDGPIPLFIPKYRRSFSQREVRLEMRQWLIQRLDWLDRNIQNIGR